MKPTYKNLDAIPNHKLKEIINSFHTTGIDGADYGPVKEELEQIYWRRLDLENSRLQKTWEQEFKALFKHQNTIKKRVNA